METILKKELILDRKLNRLLGVTAFIIFTALSAFVRIPLGFTPVPLTLQTFFVLLSGAFLGRRLGAVTQAVYLLLGLTGWQVFTGTGSGSIYLWGPTGGYLIGFVLASFSAGWLLKQSPQDWKTVLASLLVADLVILLTGAGWLKLSLGCSFGQAFFLGFLPFLPGDLLKVILATAVYQKFQWRIKAIWA